MKCTKSEKWISDLLDGRLSEGKKSVLEEHLMECPSCRIYRDHLEKIRIEVKRMEKIRPDFLCKQDFSVRLKRQLDAIGREGHPVSSKIWKWIYGTAGAAVVVSLTFFLVILQPRPPGQDELAPFLPVDSVSEIYAEISASTELEEVFNSLVLASIEEALIETGWSEETFFIKNPLDRPSLTEEELRFIESELKEDSKIEDRGGKI